MSLDQSACPCDRPTQQRRYAHKYYRYRLLRTLEDGFRLGEYLGGAGAVAPIASIWRTPSG